jgi:UDP-2-acetamido-3-amino-2,3-dideoxy-glucuronate N-acetyltransferase
MVAAGAVVTRDVPAYGLSRGNPARLVGVVCACGAKLGGEAEQLSRCPACGITISEEALALYRQLSK